MIINKKEEKIFIFLSFTIFFIYLLSCWFLTVKDSKTLGVIGFIKPTMNRNFTNINEKNQQ